MAINTVCARSLLCAFRQYNKFMTVVVNTFFKSLFYFDWLLALFFPLFLLPKIFFPLVACSYNKTSHFNPMVELPLYLTCLYSLKPS